MADPIYTLTEEDIEWEMDWDRYPSPKFQGIEKMFEPEKALAHLIINDVVFINSYWYEKTWPVEAQAAINILVGCNDVFAWGCADAQRLPHDEIEPLYRSWRKDPIWGPAIWCAQQRKEMPQGPVVKLIADAGIWDLASMNLQPNYSETNHVTDAP